MIARKLHSNILTALHSFPIVYVNGPRQAGKSTLVQELAKKDWRAEYVTFDEASMLGAAEASPESFLRAYKQKLILDEVQMAPSIFRALKMLADEARLTDKNSSHGRYLLTGSANIMSLPKLSDALVGRMCVLTLYPLSALEISQGMGNFLSLAMNNDFKPTTINRSIPVIDIIRQSTFPEITKQTDKQRRQWFEAYITTLLQRDVRQIADISKLGVLPNLLRVLANRAGGLINDADISRVIGQNAVTAKNYRILLQMLFLTYDVKPWYRNVNKRLVKAPKGYIMDTALLCHLQQIDIVNAERNDPHIFGHIFENFVATELVKQLTGLDESLTLNHFRTSDGKEVDFVLESPNGKLAAIKVKARDTVKKSDFSGINVLSAEVGEDLVCGIVLYRGNKIIPFGERLWAIPVDLLWD